MRPVRRGHGLANNSNSDKNNVVIVIITIIGRVIVRVKVRVTKHLLIMMLGRCRLFTPLHPQIRGLSLGRSSLNMVQGMWSLIKFHDVP